MDHFVLVNCLNWHLEQVSQTTDEHEKRRHAGEASKLRRRIAEIEEDMGLRDGRRT